MSLHHAMSRSNIFRTNLVGCWYCMISVIVFTVKSVANELQKQITFCFYRNYKPLASYASKQLLKTSLNHHQTAHFIFLSLYFVLPFQLEKKLVLEMLSKHYSYIIAYCQYMHKLIMASETCRSTITLIETRFNF